MKRTLIIVENILKITFRKKSNILIYLILPIITVLISMALYSNTGISKIKIGLLDEDRSVLSINMTGFIGKNEKFRILEVKNDAIEKDEIATMVSSGEIDCALIIPKGFEKNILNNSPKPVEIYSIKGQEVTAWVKSSANIYIGNLVELARAAEGNKELFDQMYRGYTEQSLKFQVEKVEDQYRSRGITNQSLGFLIFFMMLGSSFTTSLILKEKRDRTYFRICSAPVSSREYIMSNIAANLVIISIQTFLVIIIATRVLGINTYVPGWQLFLILMCFGLVSTGIGLMVVSFSKSTYQSNSLSNLIITPTCMLGGCYWPVTVMPETVQKIASFTPQKWTLEAINKIQTGEAFSGVFMELAIVLAFAGAFFLIAIYMFGIREDVKSFV